MNVSNVADARHRAPVGIIEVPYCSSIPRYFTTYRLRPNGILILGPTISGLSVLMYTKIASLEHWIPYVTCSGTPVQVLTESIEEHICFCYFP